MGNSGLSLVLTSSYLYATQQLHPLPIRWVKLFGLAFLTVIVAVVSIVFCINTLIWAVVVYKLIFAIFCARLGCPILPVKGLGYGK